MKNFWKKYSERKDLSINSLMNLEVDSSLSINKFNEEAKMLSNILSFDPNWNLLDLGGGIGLWSNFFIDKVNSVTMVEKEMNFIKIAKKKFDKNFCIVQSDVKDYISIENVYDLVFISGVTIYLSDNDFEETIKNIKTYLKPNGLLVHRDAYGINSNFKIENKFSENLNEYYSAFYRTRSSYDKIIVDNFQFNKEYDKDFYPENSIHNNRKETRLRLAIYKNIK